ncbi:MAG: ketoacyl-ACP synthase III [Desulfuromonadaceae bacterium]|nr:ketoacyl-ACP synthase III [Desulfuromonadaceae bacterium]
MNVKILDIEYVLPENVVTNNDLHNENPNWDMRNVEIKSGVLQRHIAKEGETSFDLAARACNKLFQDGRHDKTEIDAIIFCTQTPDYVMPSNAFLLHEYLNLNENVLAFDYNLACSGYVYGLAIARALILAGTATKVLLATGDTYSRYINSGDRSARVLFGDGAAVSLITASDAEDGIVDVMLATSGKNHRKFYIPAGGCRLSKVVNPAVEIDGSGNIRTANDIHMDGMAVWSFIQSTVPKQIRSLMEKHGLSAEDIDQFVFHQASKMTLEALTKSLRLNESKVYMNLSQTGNLVSASLPVALKNAMAEGRIQPGNLILMSGFGVGLSWGSLLMKV